MKHEYRNQFKDSRIMGRSKPSSSSVLDKLKSDSNSSGRIGISLILLVLVCVCDLKTVKAQDDDSLENVSEYANISQSVSGSSSLVKNETILSWEDENWRRSDKSRIAAIAVYCIVIVMALVGVGLRYFVTQYHVTQANAQLEYQQLRNVQ